ncbi:abortive infection family protein [Neiella sp. HB171785]|uniref:Abortive infection family protein n=1 Tax=Neiella litorisoli TaxID=2771431 RepID=A0A8J6QJP5_9GAMM|nr:abortive infection family protein [Neiella litorisoli]MBD1389381.1 abortive infection family protein [Neiella litorisoli]
MKQIERMNLVNSIACNLQEQMNTTSINTFLSGFGIACEDVSIVPSKRTYVEGLLKSAANDLVIEIASQLGLYRAKTIATENLASYLEAEDYRAANDDFERAIAFIDSDPEQAMGSASSILESICKGILERLAKPIPKDQTLKSLVKATYGAMDLSPESHADPDIKQVLGGIANAAVGIGVIRTKHSSFHGRSDSQKRYRLTARHARLAVGSSAVLGCFLIETYLERFAANAK